MSFLNYGLLSSLKTNKLFMFIYGILSKFYLIMAVGSLVALYWLVKGLDEIGLIDVMQKTLIASINNTQDIAKNCTVELKYGLRSWWICVQEQEAKNKGGHNSDTSTRNREIDKDIQDLRSILQKHIDPGSLKKEDKKSPYD